MRLDVLVNGARSIGSVSRLPVRVDPWGTLHAVPDRGTAFGNRGVLHDRDRQIVRGWQGRRWIVCRLEFAGRTREVLPIGGYSGLFFRDEATALAAGHRPCFECRRADAEAFLQASGCEGGVTALDATLHRERLADDARPRHGLRAGRRLHPLPRDARVEGAVAVCDDDDGVAIFSDGAWRRCAFGALGTTVEPTALAGLLTPPTSIAALRAGYRPSDMPLIAHP
jgi:hypothetical protein